MSGNDYRRVRTGDPLRVPARVYNEGLTTIEGFRAYRLATSDLNRSQPPGNRTELMVANGSGAAIPRFALVGLAAAGTLAGGDIDTVDAGRMLAQPWFLSGEAATLRHYGGEWAVYLDAAADGRVARAAYTGIFTLPVHFPSSMPSAGFADVTFDGDSFEGLQAQYSGRARILQKDSSNIASADLTKLGLSTPASGSVFWCVVSIGEPRTIEILATPTSETLISGASGRWEYEWDEVVPAASYGYSKPGTLRSSNELGKFINPAEYDNTASGTQPDGVDVDGLTGTFAKQPIREGIVLRIRGPFFDGADSSSGLATMYWLSETVANQYWGECDSSSGA